MSEENIYDIEEMDELGIDPHLALESGESATSDAYDAAVALRDYIRRTGNWGTSAHHDSTIQGYQSRMGMGTDAIGIAGPKTRAKASGLGVTLPPKPGSPVTSAPGVTGGVTALQTGAAVALRDYLTGSGDFGTVAKPSNTVARYQADMSKIKADGIVGRRTRKRASRLGVTLPTAKAVVAHHLAKHKVAPAIAKAIIAKHAALPAASIPAATQKLVETLEKKGGHSPANAAKVLKSYLTETKRFGTKAYPDARVKRLQSLMGGIGADGIVGPKTRKRAQALGVTLPPRPALYKVRVGQAVITQKTPVVAKAPTTHKERLRAHAGPSHANQRGVAAHMHKSAAQIAAKKKLAKIDIAMSAAPTFPLWDTLKFRREVLSLLHMAAGV